MGKTPKTFSCSFPGKNMHVTCINRDIYLAPEKIPKVAKINTRLSPPSSRDIFPLRPAHHAFAPITNFSHMRDFRGRRSSQTVAESILANDGRRCRPWRRRVQLIS